MNKIKRWTISYLAFNVIVTILAIVVLIISCVKGYGLYPILYMSNLGLVCLANLIWLWIKIAIAKINHPNYEMQNKYYKYYTAHFASHSCTLEWILYVVSFLLMYGTPGILAYLLSMKIHDSVFIPFLVMVVVGYFGEKLAIYRIAYIHLNKYKGAYGK